jgi:hypothetical protein
MVVMQLSLDLLARKFGCMLHLLYAALRQPVLASADCCPWWNDQYTLHAADAVGRSYPTLVEVGAHASGCLPLFASLASEPA